MARKGMIINGVHFTPDMLMAAQKVRREHGMSLRQYLIRWREVNQGRPISDLADEMGCDPSSLYKTWFPNLDIEPMHLLVPREEYLRMTGQPVPSEVAAEQAEAERREAVAELTRMRLVEAGETEG